MAQHSVPDVSEHRGGRSRSVTIGWLAGGVVIVLLVVGVVWWRGGESVSPVGARSSAGVASAGETLPVSDTYTTIDAAPLDTSTGATNDGSVVHPLRSTPVHNAPGGAAFARVEPTAFGDAWFPVVGEQDDWVQILLPSKPNGSTGWVRSADLERATTPYRIEVGLGSMTMTLLRDDEPVGEWTIGIGEPDTPTPTGRTFLLGAFSDDQQDFSPVILPVGSHSPTLDTYGGGPGTVAFHTWPTDDTYGTAVSNGCIRVPPDALEQLVQVPLGTLVMIDAS